MLTGWHLPPGIVVSHAYLCDEVSSTCNGSSRKGIIRDWVTSEDDVEEPEQRYDRKENRDGPETDDIGPPSDRDTANHAGDAEFDRYDCHAPENLEEPEPLYINRQDISTAGGSLEGRAKPSEPPSSHQM